MLPEEIRKDIILRKSETNKILVYIVVFFLLIIIVSIVSLFIIYPSLWYRTCKNIPLLSSPSICNPIEVKIVTEKSPPIPKSSGVSPYLYAPKNIYCGKNYKFGFSFLNNYEEDISVTFVPVILSSKGNLALYTEEISGILLKPKKSFQSSFSFEIDELKEWKESCEWTSEEIAEVKKFYTIGENGEKIYQFDKIECSKDKKCQEGYFCGKEEKYRCICLNWENITCNPNKLTLSLFYTHSGVFRAIVPLYYTSSERVTPQTITQEPISVQIKLIPNPYDPQSSVQKIEVYLKIKSLSGNIEINEIKVNPLLTKVITKNKESGIVVEETIGSTLLECKSIKEAFETNKIEGGKEIGGTICYLSPPTIQTIVKEEEREEKLNISFNEISSFCSRYKIGAICNKEMVSKGDLDKIEGAMRIMNVVVEIKYTREYLASQPLTIAKNEKE